ncbi:midnolin isoform X2 [Amblyraja radiata]|uniref:midnolin isoform X2 n=1 Tax=Amblyraja radiata TaxID=386614 RepID=UPI001402143C|nr:midnolin isoform X2 [Amblyraja radiata]
MDHTSTRSCSRAPTCEAHQNEPSMRVVIHTTTGAQYDLSVPVDETVEGLKRRLSQRLKVAKERLVLLHKETRLNSGKLQDHGIIEGSKLTLVPTVEAGLMSQASRPEQSVMQALESLTETQVNDFLSGRSPLTLALRVGDHMMFVQLQLAAQQAGSQLQHRHVIASRESSSSGGAAAVAAPAPSFANTQGLHRQAVGASNCNHIAACQPAMAIPAPTPPAPATTCFSPARPSSVTAGSFRSHGANTSTSGHNIAASSCTEGDCSTRNTSPTASGKSRKPGAIIESFVNHAPGVFSGTFSGTLHPNCQDSTGRPRRDITTILQILNDLLSATRHYQGMPQSLAQLRCQTQCAPSPPSPSPSPPSPGCANKTTSEDTAQQPLHSLVQCQSQIRMCKSNGERLRQTENRATRCKVERLQLLMQQKRMRRKARRDARAPYQWLPNRKSSRTNSNSSVSSDGSLDLDFEDAVWKPEVKADIKSEFVVA